MSFARTLKRITEGKADPSKRSVLLEIDKACTRVSSYFDLSDITAKISELSKVAKRPGKFNRDRFFAVFLELYELVYAPDTRGVGFFHASQLEDDCERRLYYEILKVAPTDERIRDIGPQLQRIFDVGTWWHTYIQYQLYKAGILVQAEVPIQDEIKKISSRADGILNLDGRLLLLEIKSMNSRTFAKVITKPLVKHVYQASIYAKELGIPEICFIYINKDTSEIKELIIPVDEDVIKEPYRKMRRVLTHVDELETPERICKNKFSDIASKCEYCTHCFADKT